MLLNICYSSSVLQEFHLSRYEVWWKLTNVLKEATGSVSTIKMEEPTTCNFMVGKEGMINFCQSTRCQKQDDSSLYKHCYENLIYHSKAQNATSISSSAHKIASFPNFFRILKIKITAKKQYQKEITVLCFVMFFANKQ